MGVSSGRVGSKGEGWGDGNQRRVGEDGRYGETEGNGGGLCDGAWRTGKEEDDDNEEGPRG